MATTDMGRKEGGCCAPFAWSLTQCGLGRGLLPYQVASASIQPFGHNRHEPKTGAVPILGGVVTPSNTTSPGSRFTSVPSGILIYPAVWPQSTWAKNWVGLCPFFGRGELGPHRTQSPGPRPTSIPSGTQTDTRDYYIMMLLLYNNITQRLPAPPIHA